MNTVINILARFDRAVDRLSRMLNYIGMSVLVAMMLLTVADVIGQNLDNLPALTDHSVLGSLNLTEVILVALVFLGLAYIVVVRGLTISRFPRRFRESKIIKRLPRWLLYIGVGILVAMILLTIINLRLHIFPSLNAHPVKGNMGVTEMMMVAIVFLGLAYTSAVKGHVSIDFIASRFPRRPRAIVDSFGLLVGMCLFVLICWQSGVRAFMMLEAGEVLISLDVSTFPARLMVPIGSFVVCLVLLLQFFSTIKDAAKAGRTG
jgi:TRAP-type C4-dicarboxylate transport system permease small subunit